MNWKMIGLLSAAALVGCGGFAVHCWWPAPPAVEVSGDKMYRAIVQMHDGSVGVSDRFADATLETLDGEKITISDFAGNGKPLVLIFGSFT